jgi:hypothetical protein
MTDVAQVMAMPIAQQLLREEPILHLSYTGRDGGPRVIPIAYLWDGGSFLMWTVPGSAKVGALRADPRVAITIDAARGLIRPLASGLRPRLLVPEGALVLCAVGCGRDGPGLVPWTQRDQLRVRSGAGRVGRPGGLTGGNW